MSIPVLLTIVAAVAISGWMLVQVFSGTNGIRLRNAWYVRRGGTADFDWPPDRTPPSFQQETMAPYGLFVEVAESLHLDSCQGDWERALKIAEHLVLHARDRGPIQSDLQTTYRKITGGYGYCADFVRVFMGLALAASIRCRQWGFSFDGFGGHGHTFVEVFDGTSRKWKFIDVYNNIHACDAAGTPLSALEFRDALMAGPPAFKIHRNGGGRLGFPIEEKLLAYYKRGLQEWYLIFGNAVFTDEANPLVRSLSWVSGPLGRVVAAGLGHSPPIQILVTPDNVQRVDGLRTVKRSFLVAATALGVLLLVLAVQVWQT